MSVYFEVFKSNGLTRLEAGSLSIFSDERNSPASLDICFKFRLSLAEAGVSGLCLDYAPVMLYEISSREGVSYPVKWTVQK